MDAFPVFKMPTCMKHFFKGHKWWCKRCRKEAEAQFKEVCEAYWELNTQYTIEDHGSNQPPAELRLDGPPPKWLKMDTAPFPM